MLVLVFVLAGAAEGIREWALVAYRKYVVSYSKHLQRRRADRWKARGIRAFIHVLQIFVGYAIMLAVMSYNVGVFLVALLGFGVGFFLFSEDHLPQPQDCCDGTVVDGALAEGTEETQQLMDAAGCH